MASQPLLRSSTLRAEELATTAGCMRGKRCCAHAAHGVPCSGPPRSIPTRAVPQTLPPRRAPALSNLCWSIIIRAIGEAQSPSQQTSSSLSLLRLRVSTAWCWSHNGNIGEATGSCSQRSSTSVRHQPPIQASSTPRKTGVAVVSTRAVSTRTSSVTRRGTTLAIWGHWVKSAHLAGGLCTPCASARTRSSHQDRQSGMLGTSNKQGRRVSKRAAKDGWVKKSTG